MCVGELQAACALRFCITVQHLKAALQICLEEPDKGEG